MFVTEAFAQSSGGFAGGGILGFAPFILIFVVMYFLIIRPQRQKVKRHEEMVAAARRGDIVVTAGGLIGKITKVLDDRELQIELAEGIKVKVVRSMLADVRVKGEPAADDK